MFNKYASVNQGNEGKVHGMNYGAHLNGAPASYPDHDEDEEYSGDETAAAADAEAQKKKKKKKKNKRNKKQ